MVKEAKNPKKYPDEYRSEVVRMCNEPGRSGSPFFPILKDSTAGIPLLPEQRVAGCVLVST